MTKKAVLSLRNASALVIALAMSSMGANTASSAAAVPADLVIAHARVVSPPLKDRIDVSIVIDNGRIVRIEQGSKPVRARMRIDAKGKTVLPGLIDTHVHLRLRPHKSEADYVEWIADRGRRRLENYVTSGFTTVLSVGDYWPDVLKIRQESRRPEAISPRVLISGPILTPKGGHGTKDFPDCQAVAYCAEHGFFHEVDSEEEAITIVEALADAKVEGIKIAHDGNEMMYPTKVPMGYFKPGVLKRLIDESHRRGLPVRVHAYPVPFAIEAIELGADGLVHGPGLIRVGGRSERLDELLATMREKKIGASTTLGAQGYLEDPWGIDHDTPFGMVETVPYLKGKERYRLKDAALFAQRGVSLAFGTDLINLERPIDAIQLELRLLKEAGFGNREIIQMATTNAARFIGREKDLGTIEVGKLADLILVSSDPLRSIDFVSRVDWVIRDGRVIYQYGK